MNIGIYKISSPTNKIYNGQSTNIKSRENQYKRLNCKNQPRIYNSIKKHGWEHHTFEIIEECSLTQLSEREIYWKQYYFSQNGSDWSKMLFCNIIDNNVSGKRSEVTRQKMSQSRLGKKDTEETKRKKKESNLGKHSGKRSLEFGKKMSLILKGRARPCNVKEKIKNSITKSIGKAVICYNLDMSVHKTFPSLNQASREMNLSLSSITLCCQGKRYKKVGNYVFKYL